MSKPWERIEGETAKAFGAFCTYLKMRPEERSVLASYRLYRGLERNDKTVNHYAPFFYNWSVKNKWSDRAKAYDNHSLNERLAAVDDVKKQVRISIWDGIKETIAAQVAVMKDLSPRDRNGFLSALSSVAKLTQEGEVLPESITVMLGIDRPKPEVNPAEENKARAAEEIQA